MVPGMTERERLATDARRLEWLAEATLGPARIEYATAPPSTEPRRRLELPIGLWRRGLSSARVLGQRVRLIPPTASPSFARRGTVPAR
jgi:hypothetical protein